MAWHKNCVKTDHCLIFQYGDSTYPYFGLAGCIQAMKHTRNVQTYPHYSVWSALIHLIRIWTPFPITQFLKWRAWPMPALPHVTGQISPKTPDEHPLTRSGNAPGGDLLSHAIHPNILMLYIIIYLRVLDPHTPYSWWVGIKVRWHPWVQSTSPEPKSWMNAWFGNADHDFLCFSVVLNVLPWLSQVWGPTSPIHCLRLWPDPSPQRGNFRNTLGQLKQCNVVANISNYNCETFGVKMTPDNK